MLDFCLANSRILYFWQVLESIRKFIIEIHVLQCFFVRGSNKKQRRGRIISNFTKGEAFHLLWQPSALGVNITMWPSFLHLPKKIFLSPSLWPQKKTYLETQLKGGAYWFVLKTAWVFSIPSGRVGIGWWAFYNS